MLAGVGPESWSAPGLAPAPLGTGVLSSSGIILTCSSPAPGSSGAASPPAPTSGSGGTTSGGDLWDSFSAGSGAGGSKSGSTGGVSTDGPALSSQYTGGSGVGGQGNGTGGTLSNADLWRLYWSGAGAGSSSGPANGSLANDPTLEAKYTGGSGGGPVFFVTGATGADAANSESQQRTTGSTTLTLADGQSPVMTTPLVYQPGSDDGPGVVSGVWTGGVGDVQFVLAADQDGDLTGQPLPIGRPGTPVFIVSGSGQGSQVVFDGSDLSPADGPGNPPPGPSRTWCEFLYEVYLADSVTVYGNTSSMEPGERTYTVLGFFIGNLVGVRGVSDAFSTHDAADSHEQSGAERTSDGVFGAIGLVCTALPFAKPAVSAAEGALAKLARSAPPRTAAAAAGAGPVAGSADDVARGAGTISGKVDDAAGPVVNSMAGGTPAAPNAFRGPAQRHWITKIDQGSVAKNLNTVIEPGVDVASDVAAINQGLAQRTGDRFFVNGRTYGVHDGTLYPISGLGLHQLDRGGFKALGVLMKFGDTPRAAEIMKHMGLSPEAIDAGRSAWKAAQP